MKKWLFSKNGKTLGPLNLNDAKEFVTANPDSFAWHPSYSNWMPVSCLNEFVTVLPTPKPPQSIPAELIEEFVGKERHLVEKLTILDDEVNNTTDALSELEQEIENFKKVTQNCTAQVQDTLREMEQKFASLSSGLTGLKKEVSISKQQFADTKKDFEQSVEQNNKPVVDAPLTAHQITADEKSQKSGSDELKKALAETEKMRQSVQEKPTTTVTPMAKAATTVKEVTPKQEVTPQPAVKAKVEPVVVEKPPVQAVKAAPANKPASNGIEFNDDVSEEDLALVGEISTIDDEPKAPEVEAPKAVVNGNKDSSPMGEFDHILYDALNNDKVEHEDESKRRLRRRRRR